MMKPGAQQQGVVSTILRKNGTTTPGGREDRLARCPSANILSGLSREALRPRLRLFRRFPEPAVLAHRTVVLG